MGYTHSYSNGAGGHRRDLRFRVAGQGGSGVVVKGKWPKIEYFGDGVYCVHFWNKWSKLWRKILIESVGKHGVPFMISKFDFELLKDEGLVDEREWL